LPGELLLSIVPHVGSRDLKIERTDRLFTLRENGFQTPKKRELPLSETAIVLKLQCSTTEGSVMKRL
jgi:hypothetical protein